MQYITNSSIDLHQFLTQAPIAESGAQATFVGYVRNHHEGRQVKRLYYECYVSMAEKQINRILNDIVQRLNINSLRAIHRIGWLEIGEAAVAIVAESSHRDEAFKACREAIDTIKANVPIWKKEVYQSGEEAWTSCKRCESNV